MAIFQKSVVEKFLSELEESVIDSAYSRFKEVYSVSRINQIKTLKEEQYQEGFVRDIFAKVLGYTLQPESNYNIELEKKNETDSKKADGAILKDGNVIAVIELKDNKTKSLEKIKDQAFGYKVNHKGCKYVITSNFQKLRLYVDDATEFEEFDLYSLNREEFARFYLFLSKDGLLDKDTADELKEKTKFHEEDITKKLYKDYSSFKHKFFSNAVKNNPQYDKLILFKKSQKFLDRILFVLFAEDKKLIPENAISRIVDSWDKADDFQYKPLYELFKILFTHLNKGHKYKSGYEIPAYNGGLFKADEVLDNISIDDKVLKDDLLILSKYDFNSEVDVNILGHIFEHSLSELEEVEAQIKGEAFEINRGKRKKDGVFYTPKYITKYIVENTIGKLCSEKKEELNIGDFDLSEYQNKFGKVNSKGKQLFNLLETYKKWLFELKILDPACGSGAFLNQALTFLIDEHKFIDDLIAELTNSPLRLFDTDKAILEKNIFGVDINDESIEIAKLSLWLRTAQKGRKLSNLSNNIKCGNSLIDDPEVVGNKAFNWKKEFHEVIANGGFDVVIGNPPYVRRTHLEEDIKVDIEKNFYSAYKQYDLYVLFNELALKIVKINSYIGFIQPNKFLSAEYGYKINNLISANSEIISIYNVSLDKVFEDASVYPYIFIFKKLKFDLKFKESDINLIERCNNNGLIGFDLLLKSQGVIQKLKSKSLKLGSLVSKVRRGVPNSKIDFEKTGNYNGLKSTLLEYPYYYRNSDLNFNYKDSELETSKSVEFSKKLIMMPRTVLKLRALLKEDQSHILDRIYYFSLVNNKYITEFILACLNSKLSTFFYNYIYGSTKVGGGYIDLKGSQIINFLIPIASIEIQKEVKSKVNNQQSNYRDFDKLNMKFISLLESDFSVNKISKKLENWHSLEWSQFEKELKKKKIILLGIQKEDWYERFTRLKEEAKSIKSQIDKTDREIDEMVYELYGLKENEIKIVEES